MNSCTQCKNPFTVTEQERAFYNKVSPVLSGNTFTIPDPKRCPVCREQLRLAWKNERQLYKRTCDLCKKSTISIYPVSVSFPVYCQTCWWSDAWDPTSYGQSYDFGKPFFDQWNQLISKVPKQTLHQNQNENCDYTTSTSFNRNCYLISSSGKNEDCYYGIFLKGNKDCVDNTHIIESQLCYECLDSKTGYNLKYCQNTDGCSDSSFLFDCRNCQNCFFSFGLRNKSFVFRNEQLSQHEYLEKMAEVDLGSYATIQKIRQEFSIFCQNYPRLYYDGQNNENVTYSNYIFNSKNCAFCFDAYNLEDCRFCSWYNESRDCQDIYAFGYGNELCYNSLEVGTNASLIRFSMHCWNQVSDLLYCFECHTSQSLFACAGLRNKKYCVFNKQYNQEEYEQIISNIMSDMQREGEWGEFPGQKFSPFGYNQTMAHDFYPLTHEQAQKSGWKWYDKPDEMPQATKVVPAESLPDNIRDASDDTSNLAVQCIETGRPFKILPQELRYYRIRSIPLPRNHPDIRHKHRIELRNPRRFFSRTCSGCSTQIITSYSPDKAEKVSCEACYLKIVY